jgi:GWxTD domain-containing protein
MKSYIPTTIVVLLFLATLPSISQVMPAKNPMVLTVDCSRFRGPDDSTALVEVHYGINESGLAYRYDSTGWSGSAELTIIARLKDSVVYADRWLLAHPVRDTSAVSDRLSLVGVRPLQLPRGEYTLSVFAKDRNAPEKPDSAVLRVGVSPFETDRLVLSDIEFASVIRKGEGTNPFVKNTLEVIPNVGGLFSGSQRGNVYLEAYNLRQGGKEGDLTIHSEIRDAVGKDVSDWVRPRKRVGESAVLIDNFDLSTLHSGTYVLSVSLTDTGGNARAESSRKFFVYNPSLGVDSTLARASSSIPAAVYAGMSEEDLDREFKWARYATTDAERDQYDKLKGADAKRKFLTEMWGRRPPGTRDEYLSRVAYVNSAFSSLGRDGYKTDRGRVYIVYGPPDDYERHPNESNMRPYEIWTYNNIQGGVIFVFVQRNQGSDFDLVHSTHRNELHDENWQRYAQTTQ